MPKSNNTTNGEFFCRGLTIHFIYSFSLSKKPESDDKVNYVIDPAIALQCKSRDFRRVALGNPNCRNGIMPHIIFTQNKKFADSAYVDFGAMDAVIQPDEVKININRLIRIFRTACTCTISIEVPRSIKNKMTTSNTLDFLNLVRLKIRNVGGKSQKRIEIGNGSKERWNKQESIYSIFFKTLKSFVQHCRKTKNIRLLGAVNKMIDLNKENQTPWIVTVTEVDGEIERAFCQDYSNENDPSAAKMRAIGKYEKDIAPIVFRSIGPDMPLEPTYTDPPTPNGLPGLFNMGLDSRLYINMSRRSALIICASKDKDPARFFLPDFLNICEIVRTRWHMLILMNRVIDTTMKSLREAAMADRISVNSKNKFNMQAHLLKFISLKEWLTTSSDDPGIYVVAGDALSRLNSDLVNTFRIEELRNLVMNKLSLMERIFRNYQEWRWLQSPLR
ncbi:MAG: hypothetical protein K8R67_10740 [Desulfobacteraceae bacterium]|nr:hypothetical protein [Desulfobacteraceae bacterium]